MGTLLWAAVDQFEISPAVLQELFLVAVLGVVLIVLAAAVTILAWLGLRRLIQLIRG